MRKLTHTMVMPVFYVVGGCPTLSNMRCTIVGPGQDLVSFERIVDLTSKVLASHIFAIDSDIDLDGQLLELSGQNGDFGLHLGQLRDIIELELVKKEGRTDCICCTLERHFESVFTSRYGMVFEFDLVSNSMYTDLLADVPESNVMSLVVGGGVPVTYPVGVYMPRFKASDMPRMFVLHLDKPLPNNENLILVSTDREFDLLSSNDTVRTELLERPILAQDEEETFHRLLTKQLVDNILDTTDVSIVVKGHTAYHS